MNRNAIDNAHLLPNVSQNCGVFQRALDETNKMKRNVIFNALPKCYKQDFFFSFKKEPIKRKEI